MRSKGSHSGTKNEGTWIACDVVGYEVGGRFWCLFPLPKRGVPHPTMATPHFLDVLVQLAIPGKDGQGATTPPKKKNK